MAADAISRGYKKPQQRSQTPSGAKEASPSSVIDVVNITAVRARRELVQHGARSVAFAMVGTTTEQSAGRLPRYKEQDQSRGKAQNHLLAKQKPSTMLIPW